MLASVSLFRREQVYILSTLSVLVVGAWIYLYRLTLNMPAMDMSQMSVVAVVKPYMKPWTTMDFFLMFIMWLVMMFGMMVPTVMRAALIFSGIARKAKGQGYVVAPTFIFVSGYVVIWSLYSVVATVAQWRLTQAALLSPMMVSSSDVLGAILLVSAGIYQLTPIKNICLKHCQQPFQFLSKAFQKNHGAFHAGIIHGAYCLGCCWVLMGLLFVVGVMNLLWAFSITLFVLWEKSILSSMVVSKMSGLLMICFGLVYIII